MKWDVLTDRKKTREDQRTILYNQDLLFSNALNKLSISKYALFILKGSDYLLANWMGYMASDLEGLAVRRESLILDMVAERGCMISQKEIETFYRDSILIPKEMNGVMKGERDRWTQLGTTHIYPLYSMGKELYGLFACSRKNDREDEREQKEFIQSLHFWAKPYYDLHLETESKREISQYKEFVDYVFNISSAKQQDFLSGILQYFLGLTKSSRGILYGLKGKYYMPLKQINVEHIKHYTKQDMERAKKARQIEAVLPQDMFSTELGKGAVKVLTIHPKYVIASKMMFPIAWDQEFVDKAIKITGKFLECQPQE